MKVEYMNNKQKELLEKLKESKKQITEILEKNGKKYQPLPKNEKPRIR